MPPTIKPREWHTISENGRLCPIAVSFQSQVSRMRACADKVNVEDMVSFLPNPLTCLSPAQLFAGVGRPRTQAGIRSGTSTIKHTPGAAPGFKT